MQKLTRKIRSCKFRFPSRREIRAVELGANELVGLLEFALRDSPVPLRHLRAGYRRYCCWLLAKLERVGRQMGASGRAV